MRFSDGMSFDTSGPLRTVRKSDGLYVVGNGLLIPVSDYDEAETLIAELSPKAQPSIAPRVAQGRLNQKKTKRET